MRVANFKSLFLSCAFTAGIGQAQTLQEPENIHQLNQKVVAQAAGCTAGAD
jgi:hypothetical protein